MDRPVATVSGEQRENSPLLDANTTRRAVISAVNGPVITVRGDGFAMAETVLIGGLPGEVIALKPGRATVQLYESPTGLRPGDPVEKTGLPMSVSMRPGIIGGIFDGIMRDLRGKEKIAFDTKILVREGDVLNEGDVFATVRETEFFTYRAMVPPGVSGVVTWAAPNGEYSASQKICTITQHAPKNLTLSQTWPIRTPRPVKTKLSASAPLITGQRVIDSLFPIAKGGTCAIPGGFGTGKTSLQHQIAKHCDADVIIYIGCGERGNEMTEVLHSFTRLRDPKNGAPLLERTVLIANTSDMPVAAREASIYTGITLAEFFRDMGYHVAVMADSTSRWAEALRELSGRLEEIPAEEGYPAYLAARLAAFYSRAGYVENLGGTSGSITIIGAVSPQGGDFSEPVTLHTKRFTRCFWALDSRLAHSRHFPAIDPLQSYSDYTPRLDEWYAQEIHEDFPAYRAKILQILHREHAIIEVIKLAGHDALSDDELQILQTAREIRENFTAQNAAVDPFCSPERQFEIMKKMVV
ncbi:MAG: V-type ATP synthase subunit A [Defluviitaleaceae bacterium]|nr:V-type ATP synthase subunit A [Defluviitaleaceae bacterium]